MATLKQRLHRKNASGTYDTIHFESTSDLILRPSGRTVEQDLADYLPEVQASDSVPQSLSKLIIGNTKNWIKGKQISMENHVHDTSDVVSGTFSISRFPVIPTSKGGTGRSTLTSGYFLRGNGASSVTLSSIDDVKEALDIKNTGISYKSGSYIGNAETSSSSSKIKTITIGTKSLIVYIHWYFKHNDGSTNSGEFLIFNINGTGVLIDFLEDDSINTATFTDTTLTIEGSFVNRSGIEYNWVAVTY